MLTKRLQEQQARLEGIVKTDLPRANQALAQHNLKPLTPITTETPEVKAAGN